jgi:hypothetical protein
MEEAIERYVCKLRCCLLDHGDDLLL